MANEEIISPASNTAEAWNALLREEAAKSGINLAEERPRNPDGTFAAASNTTEDEKEDVIYEMPVTVNGKEIVLRDADPAKLLEKVALAQEAGTPAAQPEVKTEPKPAFTEDELFELQLKLTQGDLSVFDTYLQKSGVLDRYFESKGFKVEDLKAQTEDRQAAKAHKEWGDAAAEFLSKVDSGEIDYPQNEQNKQLMGYKLAELGLLNKPSLESFEAAFEALKADNMIFPGANQPQRTTPAVPVARKRASSSTAIGMGGGLDARTDKGPKNKVELDITNLRPDQWATSYNALILQGYKPEQIEVKQ